MDQQHKESVQRLFPRPPLLFQILTAAFGMLPAAVISVEVERLMEKADAFFPVRSPGCTVKYSLNSCTTPWYLQSRKHPFAHSVAY